jgi:chemotaxis regulatin CheY-phosphate phosphatase CheZ
VTGASEVSAIRRVQEAIQTAEGLIEAAGQNGARFAAPLGELLEVMKVVVRVSVSCVRPAATETLPSVETTLAALVQATETAAQKVLDETDALHATQDKLRQALGRLESVARRSGPAGHAWHEAAEACEAVSTHVGAIVSAMEFQDLTAQHLTATIRAIQGSREQLERVLRFIGLPTDPDATPPVRTAAKLGAPAVLAPWRQNLADQLTRELQGRSDPSAGR